MTLTNEAVSQLFKDIQSSGIAQLHLAKECGISRMTLNNWRTGRTVPSLEKFLSVRQVIDGKLQQVSR